MHEPYQPCAAKSEKEPIQKKCFRLGLAGRLSLSPRVREIAISEIHDSTLNWNRVLGATMVNLI